MDVYCHRFTDHTKLLIISTVMMLYLMIVRDAVEGFMAAFKMLQIQNQLRLNSI